MDRGGCSVNATSTSSHEKESGPSWLPPGFRFHPTDEELVTFYLAKKIQNPNFCDQAISEADLNKCEPWELPGKAKMGEKEWYFYSLKDRKYPTGVRTNRATQAGYWKATGKDREVMGTGQQAGSGSSGAASSCSSFMNLKGKLVGMKKTLVFYNGRAPKGTKSNWVMHEYRAEDALKHSLKLKSSKDEWVLCRVFHKSASGKKMALEDLELAATLLGNSVSHHKGLDDRIAKMAATLPALTEVPWNTSTTRGPLSCSYLSGQNISASYPSGQGQYVTGGQPVPNATGEAGATGFAESSVFTALYQHYNQQVNSVKPEPWENCHLPFLQDYGQLQVGQQGGNRQVPVTTWAGGQSVDASSGRPSPDSCGSSLEFTRSPHLTMSATPNESMPHMIPRLPSDLESFWLYNSEH
ncbi:hypothetical protein GOP47_0011502 [Adiantum capillus-veneris]|uniref:NAC domain-containing protein n=1 Tax=Adiantum capillus-veneris TaxID=13818 RepID=A0A9D4USX4_ADICA|nr:hypothetical protein GOP47_0011502 [Adiantum capillus-veneris]